MAIGNVVAYYRFSTLGNRLGLGLEAQWQEVHDYLTGGDWKLVAEVVEVESSKHNSRPRLQEAFALCRAHGARLLIARLDRLARNVTFISTLVERKRDIAFVACDMPEVNEFTIHILAAVAQYEANAISERTKGSLTAVERLHRRTAPKRKRIGNDRRFITNLVDRIQHLVPTFDGGDDFGGIGGPAERLGMGVVLVEEAIDGGLEVRKRTEDAAFQAPLGEFGEESLDGIEPRA